ncbi:MAG: cation-transporting P-type ATPase [Pseudomonadales bacterium]|nr:cation-transporting P-type ATPase [Pseudomonadales bacterium]
MSAQPPQGLSSQEATLRHQQYGPNALPEVKAESFVTKLLRQFKNPLIYILLFAMAFGVVVWVMEGMKGLPLESMTILLILLANAGLGVWQEAKSDAALNRLMELAAPKSWVIRDGKLVSLPSRTLVSGDLVRVEVGERVPADGAVTNAENLLVDESMLTGESVPVDKGDQDTLYSGTLVVRGRSYIQVGGIGAQSSMGQLATLLEDISDQQTPLEKRMGHFGNWVAGFVLAIAAVILVAGVFTQGAAQFSHVFIFAVALAVAAVPESLPAVLTLALALGVERMAKRQAVVRRLAAVEALGSVTVIATDKTGTLTENKMTVKKVDTLEQNTLIRAMVLANDAELNSEAGDPLEQGLLNYVREQGQSPEDIKSLYPKVSSKPFDSRWKYMRVTVEDSGRRLSYFKGAPEIILDRCMLSVTEKENIEAKIESYAREGYRALAFALLEGHEEEGGSLTWLGLALFWDPPREEIPGAIASALQAGIRVMMITGDHPETAKSIAHTVGIEGETVVTGKMLDAMNEQQLRETVCETNIFARVSPENKLKIVEALKAENEVVAMTGDGINDAPALKAADVGIAMGIRGSDVSREVADLILMDDNFATIIAAVEEGRSIYENIQKFIRTLFSTNLSEVVLIAVGAMIVFVTTKSGETLLLPLTAVQILWINLLTDSLPALALSVDKNPGVLAMKPRMASAPLLDNGSLKFIVLVGLLGGAVALSLLIVLPELGYDKGFTQTLVFCFIVLVQLSFVMPARKVHFPPVFNRWVLGALLVGFLAQGAAIIFPPLRTVLVVESPSWSLLLILSISVPSCWLIADRCSIWLSRKKNKTV